MKNRKFIMLLLSACLIMLSGCSVQNGQTKETNGQNGSKKQVYGYDTISISAIRFKTINPILNTEKSLGSALRLVYDGLFEIDQNDNITPQIANDYKWSDDRKSVEINIKRGVKWHDGQALTADDVVFTIEKIKSTSESPYRELVNEIASARAISSQSVHVEFTRSDTSIIRNFIFPILPKHKLQGLNSDDFAADVNNLIGSGMYKIGEFQKRKIIVLNRNEDYYGQKPGIETLRILVVPDEQAQSNMFMARETDFYDDEMFFDGKYGRMNIKTIDYFSGEFEFLAFNTGTELFGDINFRKAIISGIDRKRMIEEVYLGRGEITQIPVNPKSEFYDSSIKPYEYDLQKARAYVQNIQMQAEPIKLLVNSENDQRVKAAYIIKNSLAGIGLEIEVVEKPWEEYMADLNAGSYDMVIAGWKVPLSGAMRYSLHSQGRGNILGYSSEKVDGVIGEIEYAQDREELAKKYSQLQSFVKNDIPYIPIVLKKNTLVVSDRIEGISTPSSTNIYKGVEKFSGAGE